MAEILDLNYGLAPGDHLGDILFTMFDKIQTNIQLLKNLQGPCIGTKYLDVRLAVKAFGISVKIPSSNYYVSKIVVGVPESGKYRYTVEISNSPAYGLAGSVIVKNTKLSTSIRTGKENVSLGNSLLLNTHGHILIDWDRLTPNTTYTMSTPGEGYLFATCTAYPVGTTIIIQPGPDPWDDGNLDLAVKPMTEAEIIDGIYNLYLVISLRESELSLASIELIQGKINVKNISGSAITINCPPVTPVGEGPVANAPFDGVYLQITVDDKDSVSFDIYENEHDTYMTIVTGKYTGIEAL